MVVSCLGEEEAHGEGSEVTVREVLVRRDLDQVRQVCLELSESCMNNGLKVEVEELLIQFR